MAHVPWPSTESAPATNTKTAGHTMAIAMTCSRLHSRRTTTPIFRYELCRPFSRPANAKKKEICCTLSVVCESHQPVLSLHKSVGITESDRRQTSLPKTARGGGHPASCAGNVVGLIDQLFLFDSVGAHVRARDREWEESLRLHSCNRQTSKSD